jgi:hypothetical protein
LAATPDGLIDPQRFRHVMSTFPSGVVVLTAFGEDGRPLVTEGRHVAGAAPMVLRGRAYA